MRLDKTDLLILEHLERDARLSMRELAPLAGVSTPTVSAKVKALESLGIIRGYHARLDPTLVGRVATLIALRTRPSAATQLAAQLRAEPGVIDVLHLAGGLLHVRHQAADAAQLPALLHRLDAMAQVDGYDVLPILGEAPGTGSAIHPAGEVAVPCHECDGPIHGAGVRKRWAAENNRDHVFCCRNCAASYEKRLLATAERARGRKK